MTSEEPRSRENRYDGLRGTVRLFTEALVEGVEFVKEDARAVWDVLHGTAPTTGDDCQMADCSSDAIGVFPRPGRFTDELVVCRKHWLMLHVSIKAIVVLCYAFAIGSAVFLTIIVT